LNLFRLFLPLSTPLCAIYLADLAINHCEKQAFILAYILK